MRKIFLRKNIRILFIFVFICVSFFLNIKHGVTSEQKTYVTYVDSITEDEEGGKILFPSSVFTENVSGEIYIISRGSVILYNSDFFPLLTLTKKDGADNPCGLTVDSNGNLYLAQILTHENPRHRLSVFNACLKWERDIYFEGFKDADTFLPTHLAVDRVGNIYVAGSYYPGVLVLNNQGKFLEIIAPEEEDRAVKLNSVSIDKEGKIYLVSEEEGRIYVYDENRTFLFKFGQKGGSSGKLSRPQAVAIDNRNGKMYVVDYMRHTVNVYDKDGKYLFEFGGLGWGEGWFQYPKDVAVDSQGRIFVADTFNDRVDVFKPNE